MKALVFALTLAALIVGVPAYAHHSFAAYYFEDQTISIEGELVAFEYRSPHAWVYIMAKDEKGEMQRFGAEWANPSRLKNLGVTEDTLKIGDRLIVSGSPGRNPAEHKLHLKRVQRPSDGWSWGGGRGGRG